MPLGGILVADDSLPIMDNQGGEFADVSISIQGSDLALITEFHGGSADRQLQVAVGRVVVADNSFIGVACDRRKKSCTVFTIYRNNLRSFAKVWFEGARGELQIGVSPIIIAHHHSAILAHSEG